MARKLGMGGYSSIKQRDAVLAQSLAIKPVGNEEEKRTHRLYVDTQVEFIRSTARFEEADRELLTILAGIGVPDSGGGCDDGVWVTNPFLDPDEEEKFLRDLIGDGGYLR